MVDLFDITSELILIEPFYGHFSLGVPKESTNNANYIPTAAVTLETLGHKIIFNEEFMDSLPNDKIRVGTLMHELLHIIMFHTLMRADFDDKELFNIAADMCLNQYIPADYRWDKCIMPNSFPGLTLPEFQDTSTYYDLLKQAQKSGQSEALNQLAQAMRNGQKTVCSHDTWEEMEKESSGMRDLIQKRLESDIKEVYEGDCQKNAGCFPSFLQQIIEKLYDKPKPRVDWRGIIRQFKSFCFRQEIRFTKMRPNKRFPENDAISLKQKKKLLVAIDTSGSITNQELSMFFEQIDYIVTSGTSVTVIECDASIGRIYDYSKQRFDGTVIGRGGTLFGPVIDYFNKTNEFNGLCYLTDGYPCDSQNITQPKKPALWVITPGGSVNFQYRGRKIKMEG